MRILLINKFYRPFGGAEHITRLMESIFKENGHNVAIFSTEHPENYENEYIKIETENSSDNLLVLSEIYYPAGWKAFIDGKETEIYKTNYALRSVFVPVGKHTIEMKFESPAFERGKLISTSLNIIVVILLGLGIFVEVRKRNKSKIVS